MGNHNGGKKRRSRNGTRRNASGLYRCIEVTPGGSISFTVTNMGPGDPEPIYFTTDTRTIDSDYITESLAASLVVTSEALGAFRNDVRITSEPAEARPFTIGLQYDERDLD